MYSDYIPSRESVYLGWMTNFSGLITAAPTTYGLVVGDATQLATLVTAFDTAYAAATEPTTRTHVTVLAKNAAKAQLTTYVRGLVRRIQATASVTVQQKGALGITIPDHAPTPVPAPSTRPELKPVYTRGNILTLRLRDETTPDSRAKPFGAAGAEVYVFIGENPTAPLGAGWQAQSLTTRTLFEITFAAGDSGKHATIVARWFNDKGEFGPFSDQLSLRIAGPLTQAA